MQQVSRRDATYRILTRKSSSLKRVIALVEDFGMNVTKIQSVPIIQRPFEYAFFVDYVFKEYSSFLEVKLIIETMTSELKLLGVYKNGNV